MSGPIEDLQRQIDALKALIAPFAVLETSTPVAGTWTPTFVGTTIAGTFTYVTQTGLYQRFNTLCFIWCRATISAIAVNPTGNMRIGGLPFTASASYNDPMTFGLINQFNYTNTAFQLTLQTVVSTAQLALHESFDNAADVAVPAANFTNAACDLLFSGWYQPA